MAKRANSIRVVAASDAKNNFGQVIRRVYEQEETQVIERDGLPVAAIVTLTDLERLYPGQMAQPRARVAAKRQRAARRIQSALRLTQKGGEAHTEQEVEADVQQAVQETRHRK